MSNAITIIEQDIYALRDTFNAALTDPGIKFEAEAGFAVQILASNDYALKIGCENRQSVINAVTNVAAIGISLNPARKQAYLVPRDGRICLDISYMGLIELAVASGSIMWAQSHLVFAEDQFALNGYDKPPMHKHNPFAPHRGECVGVYVVAKTRDGDYLTHCMDIASVHAIRDRSSAWKAWVEKKKKCPWVTDPGEMVKKTCIKQASKYWPQTERLDKGIHHLNVDAAEGLAELEAAPPTDWIKQAQESMTLEGLQDVRKQGTKHYEQTRDRDGYRVFAAKVKARAAELSAPPPPASEHADFVADMDAAEATP